MEGTISASTGKLFLVDRSDYNTLEVFFDISADKVDTRDIIDGKHINKSHSEGLYVVSVDRIERFKDQDFFIKAIEQCEATMNERIKTIEEGLSSTKTVKDDRDDWKVLQECNDSEYLRKTVYPRFYPVDYSYLGSSDNRKRKTKRSFVVHSYLLA